MSKRFDLSALFPDELSNKIEQIARSDACLEAAWESLCAQDNREIAALDFEKIIRFLDVLASYPELYAEIHFWNVEKSGLIWQICDDVRKHLTDTICRWAPEKILRVGIFRLLKLVLDGQHEGAALVQERLLSLYFRENAERKELFLDFLRRGFPTGPVGAAWWLLGKRPVRRFCPIHAAFLKCLASPPQFLPQAEREKMLAWVRLHKRDMFPRGISGLKNNPHADSILLAWNILELDQGSLAELVAHNRSARDALFWWIVRDPGRVPNDATVFRRALEAETSFYNLFRFINSLDALPASRVPGGVPFETFLDIIINKKFTKSHRRYVVSKALDCHPRSPKFNLFAPIREEPPPAEEAYVVLASRDAAVFLLLGRHATLLPAHRVKPCLPWLRFHSGTTDYLVCHYKPGRPRPPRPIIDIIRDIYFDTKRELIFALSLDRKKAN